MVQGRGTHPIHSISHDGERARGERDKLARKRSHCYWRHGIRPRAAETQVQTPTSAIDMLLLHFLPLLHPLAPTPLTLDQGRVSLSISDERLVNFDLTFYAQVAQVASNPNFMLKFLLSYRRVMHAVYSLIEGAPLIEVHYKRSCKFFHIANRLPFLHMKIILLVASFKIGILIS